MIFIEPSTLFLHFPQAWINNRDAGDSRRHRAHCDVIVMNYYECTRMQRKCVLICCVLWVAMFVQATAFYNGMCKANTIYDNIQTQIFCIWHMFFFHIHTEAWFLYNYIMLYNRLILTFYNTALKTFILSYHISRSVNISDSSIFSAQGFFKWWEYIKRCIFDMSEIAPINEKYTAGRGLKIIFSFEYKFETSVADLFDVFCELRSAFVRWHRRIFWFNVA